MATRTRTAADIQKEIDALRKKQSGLGSYHLMTTSGQSNNNARIDRINTQIHALSGELRQAEQTEQKAPISAITDAMKETQRRAEKDRKKALAGVTGRETSALGALRGGETSALEALRGGQTSALEALRGREASSLEALRGGQTQATGAITAGRERGLGMFAGTEELLAQARGEVSPEREAMMYEQGRTGIEAGTQAGKRRLQEAYARGGAPGGAMMRMMGDVESAGQGQLSGLQRQIQLDRYQKLMGLTGQAGQISGQKAGIVGQAGRSLADIYGTTSRGLAGVYGQAGGREADVYGQAGRGAADIYGQAGRSQAGVLGQAGQTLANIYSNTIAAVPDYPEIPSYTPSYGGGGTTTVSGGSMRSSSSGGGGMTAIDRFQQRARESTGAGITRHKAAMKRSGGFPKRRVSIGRGKPRIMAGSRKSNIGQSAWV